MSIIKLLFPKYYKEMEKRAKRRKSPWNLLLIIALPITLVIGWRTVQFLTELQKIQIPESAIFSGYMRISSLLMFVPVFFPTIILGLIITNLVVWCIPPARNALNKEAQGIKRASFKESMLHLSLFLIGILLICAPISFLGFRSYFYIEENGISISPILSFEEEFYEWNKVTEVTLNCPPKRRLNFSYFIKLDDGTEIDLMEASIENFYQSYPKISTLMKQKDISNFEKYDRWIQEAGYDNNQLIRNRCRR